MKKPSSTRKTRHRNCQKERLSRVFSHIYIYIYIERERERESYYRHQHFPKVGTGFFVSLSFSFLSPSFFSLTRFVSDILLDFTCVSNFCVKNSKKKNTNLLKENCFL
ncbi:hypothetical protein ACOSQ3_032893 [Xanthoceras sorbifolium]